MNLQDNTSFDFRKFFLEKGELPKIVELIDKRNRQANWPAYNLSQAEEKLLFLDLLEDLCSQLKASPKSKGRPAYSFATMVFACVSKVYEQLSARRATGDLQIAANRGQLHKAPHYNTVLRFFNQMELTPLLAKLIELSALPFQGYEEVFAVDASGLSSAFYSRWLDYRFKKNLHHNWMKIHIMIGVKSGIVTSVRITDGHSNDAPQFCYLLRDTSRNFAIRAVCADLAYSSRENIQGVWDYGAVPLIPFKSNATGRAAGSEAWKKMFHYFQMNKDIFMQKYHERSLIEAAFGALKKKFQGRLMMKTELGQTNEALCKILAYNLCVLVREAYFVGLAPKIEILPQK